MNERSKAVFEQVMRYALFTALALLLTFFYRRILPANHATVALSFLILILFTAFRSRAVSSIYLALLCTFLYNFFFLPPYGSLTISDPQNLVALAAFLAAAISVNRISTRERTQAAALARRQSEVEKLYDFTQRLLLEERLQSLAEVIPEFIATSFSVRAVSLLLQERAETFIWDPEHLLTGLEETRAGLPIMETASRTVNGIRVLPLLLGLRVMGTLAIAEVGYSESLYDAVGSLVAIALERANALERQSRSEAARQGEKLRSALLDSITHELRTPLTGIRMAATTLLGAPQLDQAGRTELASVVAEESARLDRLIDEAVVMARLSSGAIQVRKQSQSIVEVIETAQSELRSRLRGRAISVEVAETTPDLLMDAELMRRTWKHLLENALQYSPPASPICLTAELIGDKLAMSVSNQGPGISEADQERIFDRFYRGSNRALHAEGTGMGLAIVKAIVEAHGGGIRVSSERGHGATFNFWIPAERAD